MSRIFKSVWSTYQQTAPRDLITATVLVGSSNMMLHHALNHVFNDTDWLPDGLRKEIIAELDQWRPAYRVDQGHREIDTNYWRSRITRYSQAARALRPLIERQTVAPRQFADRVHSPPAR